MFIFERERQSMSRGGAERDREGDTECEAGPRLWAVSTEPDTGLKLTSRGIMTWAEVGHLTDWATQTPLALFCFVLDAGELKEEIVGQNRVRNKEELEAFLQIQ